MMYDERWWFIPPVFETYPTMAGELSMELWKRLAMAQASSPRSDMILNVILLMDGDVKFHQYWIALTMSEYWSSLHTG